MSGFSLMQLQKIIYETLGSNTEFMQMITGLFDHVPQSNPFPYVTFGEATGRDMAALDSKSMQHELTLQVWSREGGRKQALSIMEKMYDLLHNANMEAEGQVLVMIRFFTSRIALANDGLTYQGSMQFRCIMRELV